MRKRLVYVALLTVSLAAFRDTESCFIPNVPHGKICKYERLLSRLPIYKDLPEGTKIEEGSELFLTCESKYEPFGTINPEEEIYCNRGEWDRYPRCEPAICRLQPPQAANATLRKAAYDRSHGAVVVYDCKQYFSMSKYENVTCQFGTWTGNTPTCKDTRCDVNSLASYSIKETAIRYYKSHDVFIPMCETGFTALKPNNILTCLNGEWKGLEPLPCTPANCSDDPPEIKNGQIANLTRHHTSKVTYICNEFFMLDNSDSKVECKFGKWIGTKPTCQYKACVVPKVPHGKIGKYERHYRKLRYKELPEGTKIEEGSELYLTCESKYEPFGTTNPKEEIRCKHGEWDRYPHCEPAICRLPPPKTVNAVIREVTFNRSHGAGMVYDCKRYFTMSKYGNVTCQFGTWTGNTPTCKYSRCDTNSLASFGIRKRYKRYYESSETLKPICETGFTARKSNTRLKCLHGNWKGLEPLPCIPANCSNEPPKIENGQFVNFTRHHTSEVTYTCNEFFVLNDSDSKVECKFGKWIGTKPTCQHTRSHIETDDTDSATYFNDDNDLPSVQCVNGEWKEYQSQCPENRCYKEKLKNHELIKVYEQYFLYDSFTFQVMSCMEGFSPTGIKPKCINGKWERHRPLCKENICDVSNITHGKFTEKIKKERCTFGHNCTYWDEFHEVGRSRHFPAGSSLYVTCNEGYIHFRKRYRNIHVKCSRGKWLPRTVCLKRMIVCPRVVKLPDNEVIIDPEKEFYHIGEFVTFSCPPGQMLNAEVERIMCLPGPLRSARWSQEAPTCVNRPLDDSYYDTD